MVWTEFTDMHSGGDQKLEWGHIFIEGTEAEARVIFQELFERDPDNVTRECCGEDYSVSEADTLELATAYERGCAYDSVGNYVEQADLSRSYRKYVTLEEYEKSGVAKIMRAAL